MIEQRKTYHNTEFGNAERLLAYASGDFVYSAALGFCVWSGSYWKTNAEPDVKALALETIKGMYEEAGMIAREAAQRDTEKERKHLASEAQELLKWAKQSETKHMLDAMVDIAQLSCPMDAELFDAHPFLFNFSNGTLDLRTGELSPHRREDYLTMIVPYAYNERAESPLFLRFYQDIMLENSELMHFMHKALGLAMTGDTSEQAWFLLLGTGENGKSTLIETVAKAMGPYADALSDKSIALVNNGAGRDGAAPAPDIASLKGKRLVRVSETEEGARIATELIKRMTSGTDVEKARHLYSKDILAFRYACKLFVYSNHEPVVRETSHAFWRRVRRVPFDYTVPSEKKDKNLPVKLESEIEGILAWLVEGARLWCQEGLGVPSIIAEATQAYRQDQDLLARFVVDTCVTGPSYQVPSNTLYKRFQVWCEEEEGIKKAPNNRAFKSMMLDHGYKHDRNKQGIIYTGLMIDDGTSPTIPDAEPAALSGPAQEPARVSYDEPLIVDAAPAPTNGHREVSPVVTTLFDGKSCPVCSRTDLIVNAQQKTAYCPDHPQAIAQALLNERNRVPSQAETKRLLAQFHAQRES